MIELFIVRENEDFLFVIFKIIVPGLKSFNNCQKFPIISFISSFYQNYFPRKKNYQIPLVQVVQNQLT